MDIQLLTFGWQQFDVKDLIQLCKTNKRFAQLCRDSKTWQFLLARDYNIEYNGSDALSKYIGQILREIAGALNMQMLCLRMAMFAGTLRDILNLGSLINVQMGNMRIKEAYENKNLALSAMGIDVNNRYQILFGNQVGEEFAKFMSANSGMARFFNNDINIFDVLFYILESINNKYQTMMDNI